MLYKHSTENRLELQDILIESIKRNFIDLFHIVKLFAAQTVK